MFRSRICCSVGGTYHCMSLTRSGRRLNLNRQCLQGVRSSLTHSQVSSSCIPILVLLPFCISFLLVPVQQCFASVLFSCLIRHRLTKGSQCYKGLGQAFLPELHLPLPYVHLSSTFPSVLLTKIMQANSNERPYVIES